jgi:hypothetical protein
MAPDPRSASDLLRVLAVDRWADKSYHTVNAPDKCSPGEMPNEVRGIEGGKVEVDEVVRERMRVYSRFDDVGIEFSDVPSLQPRPPLWSMPAS